MSQELKDPIVMEEEYRDRPAPRKQSSGLVRLTAVMSALALIISCASLVISLRPARIQSQPDPDQSAPQPAPAAEPIPATVTYRDQELPVFEDVPLNQYDRTCFSTDSRGWLQYQVGENTAAVGIDVSSYQGDIDWKKVANSGVDFAMIRCGYRGYSKGVIAQDKNFTKNIRGALNAGLEVGVYIFSQAINVWEAQEEADYVIQAIKDYNITYPVAFDWEFIDGTPGARTNGMEADNLTRCAGAFCDMVAKAGYEPVIYFNQDLGYLGYELDVLKDYNFWLAEYKSHPSFFYHFDLWQYTHKGRVPGIKGDVDLNLDLRLN